MQESVLVNLHCHTLFSDGEQTPEMLAANLASAGVRYASLTDHDTLEGADRFQEALKKVNISFLPGVEITTQFDGREAHLLAYGFDAQHAELNATLLSLRQIRPVEVHSIAESMRKAGSTRNNNVAFPEVPSAAPHGKIDIEQAIQLVHRAGGKAFLAHPLYFEADLQKLDQSLKQLKTMGLDGLEVIYAPFDETQQLALRELAEKHDLLISAGTDFHGNQLGSVSYGIEMPRKDWQNFREAVFSGQSFSDEEPVTQSTANTARHPLKQRHFRKRSYVLRIFLPTLFAMALFLSAFWGFILPSFEETLLDRKREMIRELTNSAWSILVSYEREEQAGLITHEQAQTQAIERIEALRYGDDGKDYFWIQDQEPRMIMHPYRVDLNGQSLTSFTDPRGAKIFVEFAALVEREGEGYIDYVWQWKDDPDRLEPKESYVKGFEPWGWIIGTGLYIDDVNQEIARLEQSLINTALIIFGIIVLLLLFVLQQSLSIERQRQEVLDELRDSTDRYHSLVESTTEGMLLIVDGRCRYANPILLQMLGITTRQMEFRDIVDILPQEPDNALLWEILLGDEKGQFKTGQSQAGCLSRRDGSLLDCVLTLNPILVAGQQGFVLLAKDISQQANRVSWEGQSQVLTSLPIGIFRARTVRRAAMLEMNEHVRDYLSQISIETSSQPALADFFSDAYEYEQVFQKIMDEGHIQDYTIYTDTREANALSLSLSAQLIRDEQQQPDTIIGVLDDVTSRRKRDGSREALIERLQTSLLFLQEPLSSLGRDALICSMDTTIDQLSRLMTTRQVTAALVASETETIIGIVTDHDLRARVLSKNMALSTPVHNIMSAPLTRISEKALIYEALMLMEENAVRHLAVEDQDRQIVSVIDSKSLIQFQRYGPVVLSREISRAATAEQVYDFSQRKATLANSLMTSSARPRHITHMLTSACDSVTARLLELAVHELGEPPAPFAFIAMGSQGRQEQTLLTDQDNGIIFVPPEPADVEEMAKYFLRLGSAVSDTLQQAGYAYCDGKVMASNPYWCRTMTDWKNHFEKWVLKSEPQEIIDLCIFFDFRTVYGDTVFSDELRRYIHQAMAEKPDIFHHLAVNTLQYKPPVRLLGNIYLSGGATEHSGEINLKDAMMPIVSFARLYALRHKLSQTHTLDRIQALAERNLILSSSKDEITATYDFLMQLRLQTQLDAIQEGKEVSNSIHPKNLTSMQQEMLKQAFAQISAVQKKVSYDFLGGM
ncbi:MAG: cache domain-containing protein [Anaerolineaceae bacterium]|nr:cache domain-containing protein [Anaerolineaceae bacterium]